MVMKLSIDKDRLSDALRVVSHAVAGKTSLPILSYVLLDAKDDTLRLTATDLVTALVILADAKVEVPGRMTIDPRILSEWLGSIPAGEVDIDVDTGKRRVTLRSGGARITISGLDPEDYPDVPIDSGEPLLVMPATVLRDMLIRTIVATALDESRPVLHGVRIEIGPGYVDVVAADGFRMAVDRVDLPTNTADKVTAIIPRESVSALIGILGEDDEAVALFLTGPYSGVLAGRVGDVVWTSRLIDGTFPDVRQLIRREHSATVTVARESLRSAIRGSRSLSASNNDVVELRADGGGESLRVTANSAERGDADRMVVASIQASEGATIPDVVYLNWKYVTDALGVLPTQTVALGIGENNKRPVQVSAPGIDGHVAVLMPVIVGDA